jgi:hypothetical protein
MLPKTHVLKAGLPAWCYWEVVEPLRGGVQWEVLGHWGLALEGDCEPLIFSSSVLCSLAHHEVVVFLLPWRAASPHTQSSGLIDRGLTPQKP